MITAVLGFFTNLSLCYGIRDYSALPGPTGLVVSQVTPSLFSCNTLNAFDLLDFMGYAYSSSSPRSLVLDYSGANNDGCDLPAGMCEDGVCALA